EDLGVDTAVRGLLVRGLPVGQIARPGQRVAVVLGLAAMGGLAAPVVGDVTGALGEVRVDDRAVVLGVRDRQVTGLGIAVTLGLRDLTRAGHRLRLRLRLGIGLRDRGLVL